MSEVVVDINGKPRHEEMSFDPRHVSRVKVRLTGIPEGTKKLTIQSSANSKCSNEACTPVSPIVDHTWQRLIRGSFIIPVSDTPRISISANHDWLNNAHSIKGHRAEINLQKWEEGKDASVDVFLGGESSSGELEVLLEISWLDNEDDKLYYQEDSPHISIQAWADGKGPAESLICFNVRDSPKNYNSDEELIDRARERGAYSLDGLGYSIHPKQIVTIGVLRRLLENELSGNDGVSIAYIGSDTGENLYSVVRSLKNEGLWDRVSSFHVFFYGKWDKETFDKTKLKLHLEEDEKIEFFDMYETGDSEKSHDVIICTYVSPWAFGPEEDTDDRDSFRAFLRDSLDEGGLLVSVDPERDRYVRSRPQPQAFKIRNHLTHDAGWEQLDPDWAVDFPDSQVCNWTILRDIKPKTVAESDKEKALDTASGQFEPEKEKIQPSMDEVEKTYIASLKSILSWTSCASKDADAEKIHYPELRFVDDSLDFWKNEKGFEGLSWADFWKGGKTPASLFDNAATREYIDRNITSWYEGGPSKTEGTHVLSSEAGMGKSTSFRWMAREVARARGKDPDSVRLPVLVSARKMEEYWDICDLLIEGIPNEIPMHAVFSRMWSNLHGFDPAEKAKIRAHSQGTNDVDEVAMDDNHDRDHESTVNRERSFSMLDARDSLEQTIASLGHGEGFDWVRDGFPQAVAGISSQGDETKRWEEMSDETKSKVPPEEEYEYDMYLGYIQDHGDYPGEDRYISIHRMSSYGEEFAPDVEWLACAIAHASLQTTSGLFQTMDFGMLSGMVSRAIKEGDLLLFIDGLDECRQPQRTAAILASLTREEGILELTDDLRGGVFVDYDLNESSHLHGLVCTPGRLCGIRELYLSTRPEKLESIPGPWGGRTRFCKLQYTEEELSNDLPLGLLDAWGIDSGEIMALSLVARWHYPFAFLNPWCIGHVLNMIRDGTLELPKIDEWSDTEFSNEVVKWAYSEIGREAGILLCSLLYHSLTNRDADELLSQIQAPKIGWARHFDNIGLNPLLLDFSRFSIVSRNNLHQSPKGVPIDRNRLLRMVTSYRSESFAELVESESLFTTLDPNSGDVINVESGIINAFLLLEKTSVLLGRELRPSAERESEFFTRILVSSVRNSLARKGYLGGIGGEEGVEDLVEEVTRFVGFISLFFNRDGPGGYLQDGIGLEELIRTSKNFLDSQGGGDIFPSLVKMSGTTFKSLFEDDLTSLYTKVSTTILTRRGSKRRTNISRPVWEHNRMKDVAGLRLFFDKGSSDLIEFLHEMIRSDHFTSGILRSSLEHENNEFHRNRFNRGTLHWANELTNDVIEIAYSISGSKDYFDFLIETNHAKRSLVSGWGDPEGNARWLHSEKLLWQLLEKNGDVSRLMELWGKSFDDYTGREFGSIRIPIELCPREPREVFSKISQSSSNYRGCRNDLFMLPIFMDNSPTRQSRAIFCSMFFLDRDTTTEAEYIQVIDRILRGSSFEDEGLEAGKITYSVLEGLLGYLELVLSLSFTGSLKHRKLRPRNNWKGFIANIYWDAGQYISRESFCSIETILCIINSTSKLELFSVLKPNSDFHNLSRCNDLEANWDVSKPHDGMGGISRIPNFLKEGEEVWPEFAPNDALQFDCHSRLFNLLNDFANRILLFEHEQQGIGVIEAKSKICSLLKLFGEFLEDWQAPILPPESIIWPLHASDPGLNPELPAASFEEKLNLMKVDDLKALIRDSGLDRRGKSKKRSSVRGTKAQLIKRIMHFLSHPHLHNGGKNQPPPPDGKISDLEMDFLKARLSSSGIVKIIHGERSNIMMKEAELDVIRDGLAANSDLLGRIFGDLSEYYVPPLDK